MADDQTRLIINIETLLKGLEKTLRGLDAVDKKLKSVGKTGGSDAVSKSIARNAATQQRAVEALQRQRSAALIAENRRQKAATEALQKQRSAAIISEEKASIQSFQRRLNSLAQSEKQRTTIIEREARRRQLVERGIEQQNIRDFQQRINRLNLAEKQRTQVAAREATSRVRIERDAERQNLRNFNDRIKRLDRAEQVRIRAERVAFAKAPQVDSHVQAFRRLEQANNAASAAAAASVARFQALGNSLRSIGQSALTAGFGLTAVLTIPLVEIGKFSLDAAVRLDSLKRGLTAIVGSAEEAGTQLTRLTEIAKLPGIGFEEAIQGSIRLQAVGFSAADAEKALIQFSNAVALTGGGREELARITVQLGQLAAKGKVLSQDLRPIIEAAPAVGRALKNAFGTVNADDIAELTGSSQEFFKVLTAELEKLPRAAAGARNTFENFRDAVFRASTAIGDALIPVLTKLINFFEPIITKLAESFRALPEPVQTVAVLMGALGAALGPLTIGFGILALTIGRAVVGFTALNAQGLIPSIASLRAFNVAATATIARLTGLQAATIRAGGPWVALAAAIATVVAAIVILNQKEEEALAVDVKGAAARNDRIKAAKDELKFLEGLTGEVQQTKQQQTELARTYATLSGEAKGRIALIDDETEKLKALIEIKKEQLKIDQFAAGATLVQLVNNVTIAINKQTKAQEELNAARKVDQAAKEAATRPRGKGEREDIFIDRVTTGLGKQRDAALLAAAALEKIGETKTELNAAAQAIVDLSRATGISTKELLAQARAAGADAEEIEKVTRAVEDLAREQRSAIPDLSAFNNEIARFNKSLLQGAEAVADEVKRRKALIDANVLIARESSDSFDGALRAMKKFINTQPDLRASIQKEAQLAGKTFEEFVREALGEKGDTKGTALRNAQEALADASAKVSQESAERLIAIEKSKNDQLLRENETRFSKELISYREFIEERSRLQQLELQGEIDRQKGLAETAAADAARQAARAGATTGAERTRALAAEQTSRAKAIEAEIRILDLQSRQKDVAAETANELREFSKDRERDFRELKRELDEIIGKEKEAGEAAVDERFRDTLRDLNNEIERTARLLVNATNAAERGAAAAAIDRLTNEKEFIETRVKQLKGVVAVRAAQDEINRAEERQLNLEKDLAFQVEFRGLNEREAIRQRLDGEKLVKAEIEKQQAALKETILAMKRAGLEVPLALLEGLARFKVAAKGLGELTFAEQFAQAEEDLIKVSDRLAEKIADVERAVRSRTISEVEGRLIIRRLNGEYVGELERQLEILKEIARQSDDASLIRQAKSAEQSVKDTRAAADELQNFRQQLESVSIDSFGDSLSQLFKDLRDNTESAAQDILNFFNNIANRVSDFIAENFAQRIAESLFPDAEGEGGILNSIKGLFGGGGGEGGQAAVGTALGAASTTLSTAAASLAAGGTAAATALTGGGAAAATSMVTGAAGLSAAITAAAAGFSAAVIAAGAAFAAAVTAAAAAQGASSAFSAGAATGMFPAVPGGVVRIVEGGYPEAVLTTDPKHALRQAAILREFLKRTRGLYGKFREIPEMAAGGFVSAREAEMNLLNSIQRSSMPVPDVSDSVRSGGLGGELRLRQILVSDQRDVKEWMNSAEGEQVQVDFLTRNRPLIKRLAGGR